MIDNLPSQLIPKVAELATAPGSLTSQVALVVGSESPNETLEQIEELYETAKEIIKSRSTEEWLFKFDKAGVPAGPVKFVQEMLDDEQVKANDMVVEVQHSAAGKIRMAGPMVKMSETPLQINSASPSLGEHTELILDSLGYTEQDISKLRRNGVIR